ncbi:MAG: ribonuclease R [Oscillospiraceae bacterium]
MKIDYKKLIYNKLKKSGKKPVTFKELLKSCRKKHFDFDKFVKTIDKMKSKGEIVEDKWGFKLVDRKKLKKCEIVKLNKTYGFARNCETGEEIFIVGKFLKGAMPQDIVLVRTFEGMGECLEGEVMEILEENFSKFTGLIVEEFGKLKIVPDTLSKYAMDFDNSLGLELHEGDKVMAEITKRGEKHSQHQCRILSSFGSSLKASVCAMSVLELNNIKPIFPPEVIAEAKEVSDYRRIESESKNRLDLRDKVIFTIDGADTKDIDDAISVYRTENGYELGVHIADVSFYVKPKSRLDNEAFNRGTSVYYANRVVPMLPKELSNGICSLNPQEDRLAFSALINLDNSGEIIDYTFKKTIIRSRVKGVYSEINRLLSGEKPEELMNKYSEVLDYIPIIQELADKLNKKKIRRGAPELESIESVLVIDDRDICVDVLPRTSGESQEIIENFMLTANECAARFGLENGLPFVYRVHEPPTDEKNEILKDELTKLNVPYDVNKPIRQKEMSEILSSVKGTDKEMIVNNLVLRSMSKARYDVEPLGHFGLVLNDYAHFTSPIRRYPDLTIHRIMSTFLEGNTPEQCNVKFQKFVHASADQSTNTELVAMTVERDCEDCYKAEYMSSHIGEEYDGVISSVTDFGFFVLLANTCEGLVRTEEIGEGEYFYDGSGCLKNLNTGTTYSVGDSIRIKVLDANVNSGKIDFSLGTIQDC